MFFITPNPKKLLVLFLFLFAVQNYAQVPIWSKNFSSYANGSTIGIGNKWTSTSTSGIRYFEVHNNEFDARYTNAREQIFATSLLIYQSFKKTI